MAIPCRWLMAVSLVAAPAPPTASTDLVACIATPESPDPSHVQREVIETAARRLSGFWTGAGLGGQAEEWWSEFDGREMYGVFRMKVGGQPEFYEFLKMELAGERPRLIVRHLNPDGSPWTAERVDAEFPLIAATDTCLLFHGLAYDLSRPDQVRFSAVFKRGDEENVSVIEFRRAGTR